MSHLNNDEFQHISQSTKNEIQKRFSEILFNNLEYEKKHNPYNQEIREKSSIRDGNLEQLKQSWEESYTGEVGTLAKTPLRHSQNLGIVLTIIASRAAIEGGILPEIAFSLSDIIIQQIEEATKPDTAFWLGRYAEYLYTVMVNESKISNNISDNNANSHIIKCKDYIFTHLHDKILISDIADELYLNKNYLCELFKQEEGITIGEYILNQKIHFVKNLLIYSHLSYSEIATYFGFSSQSHLGQQFKKVTGMTLHKFREKYGKNFS